MQAQQRILNSGRTAVRFSGLLLTLAAAAILVAGGQHAALAQTPPCPVPLTSDCVRINNAIFIPIPESNESAPFVINGNFGTWSFGLTEPPSPFDRSDTFVSDGTHLNVASDPATLPLGLGGTIPENGFFEDISEFLPSGGGTYLPPAGGTVTVTALAVGSDLDTVPEPGTVLLIGSGLLGLSAYTFRRPRRSGVR
jgi:PEP-CTERM motif